MRVLRVLMGLLLLCVGSCGAARAVLFIGNHKQAARAFSYIQTRISGTSVVVKRFFIHKFKLRF